MGTGALCMTKHYKGIEQEFQNGVHLITWKTFAELESLIKYYLDNETQRKKIAENGRNLAREHYTWRNRINQLKDIVHKYDITFKTPRKEHWIDKIGKIKPFRVYSQNNEDAYLSYILSNIGRTRNGFFVDLGAGDGYSISNTKYFREYRNFKGIMIDGNNHGNDQVTEGWITRENIVKMLKEKHCPVFFDLLSIDLDGNDWHILNEILLMKYHPSVIIAEINPKFKRHEAFMIKYNASHQWAENDYYGMSLAALEKIAQTYGYKVVFVSDSLNAYLVRDQIVPEGKIELNYKQKRDFPLGAGEWIEIK